MLPSTPAVVTSTHSKLRPMHIYDKGRSASRATQKTATMHFKPSRSCITVVQKQQPCLSNEVVHASLSSSSSPLGRWSRSDISTHYVDPFRRTTALLVLDFCHVRVTSASASHSVLLGLVEFGPVLVFLEPRLVVKRRLLQKRYVVQLSSGGVGRAVLDGRVAVSYVSEVMDLLPREQEAGSERVNGRVTPLEHC